MCCLYIAAPQKNIDTEQSQLDIGIGAAAFSDFGKQRLLI